MLVTVDCQAVGEPSRPAVANIMETYVQHLCLELQSTRTLGNPVPLQTLFFGGGVTSFLAVMLPPQHQRCTLPMPLVV